jgi:predicted nuclease of restriction endonuclease-like (RecB) superfamily
MIQFAQVFPDSEIIGTLCQQLSWSHFYAILPVEKSEARDFYVRQAVAEHLTVRELRAIIARKAYERREIADSQITPGTAVPLDTFSDPYLLDFLNMHDEYSEADLEASIIRELEKFLLEFGRGFTFVERQKRIRFDEDDYYLDLLLYNRELRRLVAVELKIGAFKPAYKGQMDFYLKWLNRYERRPGEEAPIGLLLVAKSNREVLELMECTSDGIIVAEYWTEILPKQDLQERLNEILRTTRERLARRGIPSVRLGSVTESNLICINESS